ncbi:aminoglycoside phosphotransferase family protein [Neobacillus sp. PS3-40]|uniref:aminoglycoside phosphotransferase family protein n=1 Tax=Neobacillus sp. PS3-40 TaxID=3070679 RepID=UPI0027E13D01|nr:aminoglycoside phosphotransferase family protein [Neobacillus sp. PS3-40]WML44279.1 aminoglycoside phosphotransferase family protein [Neobacillus sp. PS3-40]
MEKGKLIGQGRTSEVFEWGADKVLKLFRSDFPKIAIENEYKTSLNINVHLNLTPKVYKIVEIDDRTGIIYQRVNGITMMEKVAFKPWSVKSEAKKLAELHESIQQKVDFTIPNNKIKLKDNISETDLVEDKKNKLYEYIDKLADGNVLCHGDFHPDNIILTKDKPVIIDWMTATRGNPGADIARTSIMFKYGVIPEKTYIEVKIINFIRKKFYLEYLKHYTSISNVKIEEVQQWELPIAAARLNERIPENEKLALFNFISTKIEKIK